MCGLFQSYSSFQNAHQASDYSPYWGHLSQMPLWNQGIYYLIHYWLDLHRLEGLADCCNSQLYTLSVVALLTRPSSVVVVCCVCSVGPNAREIEDSSKAMSSAKSRSFNDLWQCALQKLKKRCDGGWRPIWSIWRHYWSPAGRCSGSFSICCAGWLPAEKGHVAAWLWSCNPSSSL